MKDKVKKNWQVAVLLILVIASVSLFVACFYLNQQVTQNQQALAKLEIHEIARQKEAEALVLLQKNIINQYVDTANLVLSSNQDTKTAILLLDAAKKYADSQVLAGLDKKIALLKAINLVNGEELIAQMDIIGQSINSLSIIPNTAPTAATKVTTPCQQSVAVKYSQIISKFWTQLLASLKDIVIIRHHDLEPYIYSQQEATVRFNLDAKLMQAQLAVIQKHDAIYHSCLTQMTNMIQKYFIGTSGEKEQVLQAIAQLQKINLQPQLPKITLENKS